VRQIFEMRFEMVDEINKQGHNTISSHPLSHNLSHHHLISPSHLSPLFALSTTITISSSWDGKIKNKFFLCTWFGWLTNLKKLIDFDHEMVSEMRDGRWWDEIKTNSTINHHHLQNPEMRFWSIKEDWQGSMDCKFDKQLSYESVWRKKEKMRWLMAGLGNLKKHFYLYLWFLMVFLSLFLSLPLKLFIYLIGTR